LCARLFCGDEYENYAKNGTNATQMNWIFTIDNLFKMQIIVQLVSVPDKSTFWFPDHDKNVKIIFEIIGAINNHKLISTNS
jgi:hypothetical protein